MERIVVSQSKESKIRRIQKNRYKQAESFIFLKNPLNIRFMIWENLQSGLCPKCSSILIQADLVKCSNRYCKFLISIGKYGDLAKGKKSSVYQQVVLHNKKINKFKSKEKLKLKNALESQTKERESNLRRMKAKNLP